MESATEKKEHWVMIDLTKVINPIDFTSLDKALDSEKLSLLKEILTYYEEQISLEKELEIRIEKNIKIQKKIVMGFLISAIIFVVYMNYTLSSSFEPTRLIFVFLMVLTAGYIWIQRPGP